MPEYILLDAVGYDVLLNLAVWVFAIVCLALIYRLRARWLRFNEPIIPACVVCLIAIIAVLLALICAPFSINQNSDDYLFVGLLTLVVDLLGIATLIGLVILCLQQRYRTEPRAFWTVLVCFIGCYVFYPTIIAAFCVVQNQHSPYIKWCYERGRYELLEVYADPQSTGSAIVFPYIPSLLPELWRLRAAANKSPSR